MNERSTGKNMDSVEAFIMKLHREQLLKIVCLTSPRASDEYLYRSTKPSRNPNSDRRL
jgi:hypothetical protein